MMVRRMGMMIGIRPEMIARYRDLHAAPWAEMNALLTAAHIANYSIFLREPENLLFGYWEYTGSDYAGDMARLSTQEVTAAWLALTDPCQIPLPTAKPGERWSDLEPVFHLP